MSHRVRKVASVTGWAREQLSALSVLSALPRLPKLLKHSGTPVTGTNADDGPPAYSCLGYLLPVVCARAAKTSEAHVIATLRLKHGPRFFRCGQVETQFFEDTTALGDLFRI